MTAIELLKECKEALINRDAVKCYDSGEHPCNCTLCKIERFIGENNSEGCDHHFMPPYWNCEFCGISKHQLTIF